MGAIGLFGLLGAIVFYGCIMIIIILLNSIGKKKPVE